MKIPSLVMAILFLLLILPISGSWGGEGVVPVYIKGEKMELNLKKEDGKYHIYRADLIELLEQYYPDEKVILIEADGNGWVAFRHFWENFNHEVIWLEGVGRIVVAKKSVKIEIPLEVKKVLKEAIADTNWIKLKTAEEIKNHLGLFYSEELTAELTKDVQEFTRVETDWHSVYELSNLILLDSGHNWLLVQVEINEYNYSYDQTFLSEGVVKLIQTEKDWQIVDYQYFNKAI